MTDLFSEIEQDLRREQASKLWEKYGIYIAGLALAIILIASAIIGWRAWQQSRNAAASDRFDVVVAEAAKQKPEEAAKTLGDFASGSTRAYAALARMHQAEYLLKAGDRKAAVAALDEIAGQSGLPDIIRGLARIKAGLLVVDTTSYDELNARLSSLNETDSPWRNNARELLGLSAYKAGKYAEAAVNFASIVADPSASAGLRDRAHVMQALLSPHLPQPGADKGPEANKGSEADKAPENGKIEDKPQGENMSTPATNPVTNNTAAAVAAPDTKSE